MVIFIPIVYICLYKSQVKKIGKISSTIDLNGHYQIEPWTCFTQGLLLLLLIYFDLTPDVLCDFNLVKEDIINCVQVQKIYRLKKYYFV